MVIIYHDNSQITKVSTDHQNIQFDSQKTISDTLHILAQNFPDKKIVWCNTAVREELNLEIIPSLLHHNKIMLSYSSNALNFFDAKIGYIEESLFVTTNKKVTYPTWQMSSVVGVVSASFLNEIKEEISKHADFDYYLNAIAKLAMPKGLLCYSEPKLLKHETFVASKTASIFILFRFVKQHYKTRWVFLLFFNLIIYEKKFPLLPMLFSFFYKKYKAQNIDLEDIDVQSSSKVINKGTIDVIIPTIGRAEYLYDIVSDLSKQTVLPHKIIIIEQNPVVGSHSNLSRVYQEKWPFKIQHLFIHQSGACNARNLALDSVESEWVFLADDDIRIPNNFIEKAFNGISKFGVSAVSLSCLQKKQKPSFNVFFQWGSFGSGCSIVKAEALYAIRFNMAFEFGYGEDSDFGMQLRNAGYDVLYFPHPEILHLKAPIGGFRTNPELPWQTQEIQPKPSPTVMLYKIIHNSREQILGYKTVLFFKYYKLQNIKNPYRYFIHFQKQWDQSVFWANQLKLKS